MKKMLVFFVCKSIYHRGFILSFKVSSNQHQNNIYIPFSVFSNSIFSYFLREEFDGTSGYSDTNI